MQHRNCLVWLLVLSIGGLWAGQAGGQIAPGRKARAVREGEVITPPARGERYDDSLRKGQEAPDFTLSTLGGEEEVSLSTFRGKQPVVLVFGSLTCPPFRRQVLEMDKLYEQHKDKAAFLFVYIREAHPDSVLHVVEDGVDSLQKIEQTDTLDERSRAAKLCYGMLKLKMPGVVDKADNVVSKTFAGWPNRLVIVDRDGKLAHISGPGPRGFKPQEVEDWLRANAGGSEPANP